MTNFQRITQSTQTLGMFLKALPIPDGPWDAAFRERYCTTCPHDTCPDVCPNSEHRNDPTWWLEQEEGVITR